MYGRCFLFLCAIGSIAFGQATPGQPEYGSWNLGQWNVYVPVSIDLTQFAGDFISINCSAGTISPSAANPAPPLLTTGVWELAPPTGLKVTCTVVDHDTGQTITFTLTFLSDGTVASTSGLTTSDPVATATGELFNESAAPDLSLGGPLPLEFRRYYGALIAADGLISRIGTNWTHNFEWALRLGGAYAQVVSPLNQVVSFQLVGGAYQLIVGEKYPYQLIAGPNNTFQFHDPVSNLIYTFAGSGNVLGLSAIRDRSGNTLTITQPSAGVFLVADGLGRTLTLNFDTTSGNVSKVIDQAGRFVTFAYSNGYLTQATDANGKAESFTYTAAGSINGLMTSHTLPLGNKPFSQTFDTAGRVATQTDSRGNTTNISYDASTGTTLYNNAAGVVMSQTSRGFTDFTSFIDPDHQTISAGYDSAARRNLVTDRFGDKTSRTYDAASGQIATETNAAGSITSYTWTPQAASGFTFFNLTKVTASDGGATLFTYDANGNVLTETDASGKVTKFTYNTHGQQTSVTDPAGRVTSATYGADGTLASTTDAAGNVTTYSYDLAKRVTQVKFADGTSRSAVYDNRGNILKVTDERGKITQFAYNDNNEISGMTDALGKSVAVAYDTDDHISSITDRAGKSEGFTYNSLGFTQSMTTPAGETSTYSYDTHNRLSSIVDSSGKGDSYAYDKEDVPASITDGLSRKTSYASDKLGYFTQIVTPLGEAYVIARNAREGVLSTTDPSGIATSYGFDSLYRLSTTTVGGITSGIARDSAGLLTSMTDPNGGVWSFNRDAAGRVGARVDPLNRATAYVYDNRNRISSAQTASGSVTFTYDAAGNITNRKYSDGTNLTYTFDDDNRLTSANGVVLAYDANGRITNSNGVAITRDGDGRIASITYAPGKTVTYTYNSQGLLSGISDWASGSMAFAYDAARELVSITRPNKLATRFTYDLDGRISSINEDAGSLAIAIQRDDAGKVTSESQTSSFSLSGAGPGMLPLTYDAADQVNGFTYDAMGRVTTDSLHNYTWDLASRMTSRSGVDGASTAAYDAFGLRTSVSASGATQNFIWNYATGLPTIATIQNGSADQQYLIYAPNGTLLYAIDASSNARTFFHFDAHGSTTMLTNDAGTVTDTYSITPYGESVAHTGSNANSFTWMGAFGVMQEGATGLFYDRARYYDSTSARFLSPDSQVSSLPLQMNPYQFALDNPVANTDASGAAPQADDQYFKELAHALADADQPPGTRGSPLGGSPLWNPLGDLSGFGGGGMNVFSDPIAATPNALISRPPDSSDFLNLNEGARTLTGQSYGSESLVKMLNSPCGSSRNFVYSPLSYRTGGNILDPTPKTYKLPNPGRGIARGLIWTQLKFLP